MQIAEGKIQRTKKVKSSNKIREEAFNEYMKMFLKERKKGVRVSIGNVVENSSLRFFFLSFEVDRRRKLSIDRRTTFRPVAVE